MARAWPRALGAANPWPRPSLATPTPWTERVDPIAVALGVAAALEDDDARSLAGQHAVGGGAKGPRRSGASEGAQLAEDEREVNVGLEVDAAGDRQIGATRGERAHREVKRHQG